MVVRYKEGKLFLALLDGSEHHCRFVTQIVAPVEICLHYASHAHTNTCTCAHMHAHMYACMCMHTNTQTFHEKANRLQLIRKCYSETFLIIYVLRKDMQSYISVTV